MKTQNRKTRFGDLSFAAQCFIVRQVAARMVNPAAAATFPTRAESGLSADAYAAARKFAFDATLIDQNCRGQVSRWICKPKVAADRLVRSSAARGRS
jgi:hypothetical protein